MTVMKYFQTLGISLLQNEFRPEWVLQIRSDVSPEICAGSISFCCRIWRLTSFTQSYPAGITSPAEGCQALYLQGCSSCMERRKSSDDSRITFYWWIRLRGKDVCEVKMKDEVLHLSCLGCSSAKIFSLLMLLEDKSSHFTRCAKAMVSWSQKRKRVQLPACLMSSVLPWTSWILLWTLEERWEGVFWLSECEKGTTKNPSQHLGRIWCAQGACCRTLGPFRTDSDSLFWILFPQWIRIGLCPPTTSNIKEKDDVRMLWSENNSSGHWFPKLDSFSFCESGMDCSPQYFIPSRLWFLLLFHSESR